MAKFMVRVELHGAKYAEDYKVLHEHMTRAGFSNQIRSDSGSVYELPPAEYVLTGGLTREQVLEKAKQAATATRKPFAVVVSEYTSCSWYGLDQVRRVA